MLVGRVSTDGVACPRVLACGGRRSLAETLRMLQERCALLPALHRAIPSPNPVFLAGGGVAADWRPCRCSPRTVLVALRFLARPRPLPGLSAFPDGGGGVASVGRSGPACRPHPVMPAGTPRPLFWHWRVAGCAAPLPAILAS